MDTLLAKLVNKLKDDPRFLGASLRARYPWSSWEQIAEALELTMDQLNRLALCQRPRGQQAYRDIAAAIPLDVKVVACIIDANYEDYDE